MQWAGITFSKSNKHLIFYEKSFFSLLVLLISSCSINDKSEIINSKSLSPEIGISNRISSLLQNSGLPTSTFEKKEWLKNHTWADAEKMSYTFKVKEKNLSASDLDMYNSEVSRLILSDFNLLNSQNKSDLDKINSYGALYFKSGGNDVKVLFQVLKKAKQHNLWNEKKINEATWYTNKMLDLKVEKYNKLLDMHQETIKEKPYLKKPLEADDAGLKLLLKDYKAIKPELSNFKVQEPLSKDDFMK
ncbi:hypothetical protein [Runella sp.]|jgi:hypothetical protein|uniref:hypothetical protein n=1 Tax=Runella sp. TaxID=1960881 RepID=UPI0026237902|nr:hypothetical protein [Runella sp.]